jgi:acetyl-CoA acyltransferase
MTMVPMGGNKLSANPDYFEKNHENIAYSMGITAEIVAERWHITREMQDQFALQSHQRALNAIQQGFFKNEILPIETHADFPDLNSGAIRHISKMITVDEGPRADTNLAALAKLPTVFKRGGTVTAGNSSQISDGAGIVLVVSEKALKTFNLTPMARFIDFEVAGVPPEIMGIGPKEAIPLALQKTGIKQEAISWIELNEAFAAQSLAVIKDLNLDPAKVNPCGGAIALGHPLGATGAIRTATLLHGLQRTKQKYGMVTMCIGTGMGAAGIFENLC